MPARAFQRDSRSGARARARIIAARRRRIDCAPARTGSSSPVFRQRVGRAMFPWASLLLPRSPRCHQQQKRGERGSNCGRLPIHGTASPHDTDPALGEGGGNQLLADVNARLRKDSSITSMRSLESAFDQQLTQLNFAKDRPRITELFDFHTGPPATVSLRAALLDRFDHISDGNENGSTALVLLRFPFVASTMLSYGLFSPVSKSGLWVRKAYGPINFPDSAAARSSIPDWSARENPYSAAPSHSVDAVSIAQFFTLAAQGRIVDSTTSQAILHHLELERGGCATTEPDLDALTSTGQIAAKCGYFQDVLHVPLYFKSSASSRELVVVILTRASSSAVVKDLFADLIALVP